jgi:hypothetical protein
MPKYEYVFQSFLLMIVAMVFTIPNKGVRMTVRYLKDIEPTAWAPEYYCRFHIKKL